MYQNISKALREIRHPGIQIELPNVKEDYYAGRNPSELVFSGKKYKTDHPMYGLIQKLILERYSPKAENGKRR